MTAEQQQVLGVRIRELRAQQDLSLGALERASGVSKGYLSQLERGEAQNPSLETVRRIAAALGVGVSDLAGEETAVDEAAPGRLPAGLKAFAESAAARGAPLTSEDVAMLKGIRYRGRPPKTEEDYALLYDLIRRIAR